MSTPFFRTFPGQNPTMPVQKKFQDISRTSRISRTVGHPAFWFTTQEPNVFQIYAGTK